MLVRNHGPSLVVNTPAKLNLFLEVLGRRPDGYHELETVMVSIGLYDTLLFTEDDSQQTYLRCRSCSSAAPLPTGADNLIVRAVQQLREATGCDRGVSIDLWKRIPLAAGLGGGSSDAAATLVGLNRLWDLGLSSVQLHQMAAALGSDVNFFLDSPLAATCRGRGEQILPLAISGRMHFVVVCPDSGLSTAQVFRHWKKERREARSSASFVETLTTGRLSVEPGALHNALEEPARRLNADVSRVLMDLRDYGRAPVLMSGSGTSCFAVCRTSRSARSLAGRLRHLGLGRVFAVEMRA